MSLPQKLVLGCNLIYQIYSVKSKPLIKKRRKKIREHKNSLLELEVPTKFVGATMCKVERLLLTTFSILKAISKNATRLKRL